MTTNALNDQLTQQQEKIAATFALQRAHQRTIATTTAKQRIAKLKKLMATILKYKAAIREAMYKDFKKHESETDLTEILPITSEIKHVISHLPSWMRAKKVTTPLTLLGTSSYIHYEAKGVVLIISPWNFPVNLTFCPLISAIAAGNCVMLKPSEHTPNAAAVMRQIVEELYDEKEVAIFEGDHTVATSLLKLPFDHMFFTGSPSIGKIVMRAAAEHLSSITLELGGKSPTIVDETANLEEAAGKIAWAKYLNNGQVCIAPDYVFVHESKKEELLKLIKAKTESYYTTSPLQSKSYGRMVNTRHYQRVKELIEGAQAEGAKVEMGAQFKDEEVYIAPTLLSNVKETSKVMQEEIFGPVLPVMSYQSIEEVIDFINQRAKPLALYIYSKSKKNIDHVIRNTSAGGTCINDSVIHFFNNYLPFGGVNNSGIGKSHGVFGFEAFSNARSVLKQNTRFFALKLMLPPYTPRVQKLIDLTMKWF